MAEGHLRRVFRTFEHFFFFLCYLFIFTRAAVNKLFAFKGPAISRKLGNVSATVMRTYNNICIFFIYTFKFCCSTVLLCSLLLLLFLLRKFTTKCRQFIRQREGLCPTRYTEFFCTIHTEHGVVPLFRCIALTQTSAISFTCHFVFLSIF